MWGRDMRGVYADINLVLSDGDQIILDRSQPARSFVGNFMRDLYGGFTGTNIGRIDTDGASRVCLLTGGTWNGKPYYYEGGFGIARGCGVGGGTGIVLGSSNVEFDVNHYKLGAVIAHGTGVGQMYRGACGFVPPTIADDERSVSIRASRSFSNNSTEDVTVREVGLYGNVVSVMVRTYGSYLYARDVLDADVVVSPGQQLNVEMFIKTEL